MPVSPWLMHLPQHRVIAVIRCSKFKVGQRMAKAVAEGGIRSIEITWNSDRPADLIGLLRSALPDQEQTKDAIAAGAQFLFTPHVAPDLIRLAVNQDVPMVAGALSPTEIVQAWQAGVSSVKVFPVQALGGAAYIKSLQGPLGHIPLIPTGGVTVDNAEQFLSAGAIAVGLSSSLFPQHAITQGEWEIISQQTKNLMQRLSL
jgi:2-dehydro-3-deoxyphosphogluconate aldolase/(4S)-4-hydroxy-2-oxoglutarate aldolase